MMKRNFLAAAVAALAVQSAMPAAAEDADKCCFRLTPYYWAVGIDGNLEINDEQGSTDIDFNQDIGDVTDNLEVLANLGKRMLGYYNELFLEFKMHRKRA